MQQNEIIAENGQSSINTGEIILYQPDNSIRLEVRMEQNTVWLTQAQMKMLFQTSKQNISLHIGNIFKEGELDKDSVVKDFLTTATDGEKYRMSYYNLDEIFDAYTFASDLIRSAQRRIVLIDNYIDDTVYHLGASLKDLGKKLFAFSKMEIGAEVLSV